MSGAKACLGYSSRTEAVVALRAQGLATNAIAIRIGIPAKNVSSLEASARRIQRERKPAEVGIRSATAKELIKELVPHHQRELVRRHAAVRNMSCTRLIQEIVDCVIRHDLIDAVLDDGKSGGRA